MNSVSAVYSESDRQKYNVPVVVVNVNYSFYEKVSIYNDNINSGLFNTVKRDASVEIKIGLNN